MSYHIDKTGKESLDYHYYISSAEHSRADFAAAVPEPLEDRSTVTQGFDVCMKEDLCLLRKGDSSEILTCMRHLSLNMFLVETTKQPVFAEKEELRVWTLAIWIGY
ncbi:hypothetical protein C6H64_17000 [Photorhabdus luminescens]|uniref:Uncharacterized protein n=1 Tax=Photorhabdus laumondii subsp. clarkei TaxID=2029685 RepID=A0A329VM99_9GAMM|nr:hypothetical protein [Photorhabdus laumondii]PQQ27216.1 hypothetical protein C6H64_17000 [Photorhabdus luminescens]RAW93376.1 hypothetical protein CKY01_00115 [Photorhabdus laumondii subsp. clarkei]